MNITYQKAVEIDKIKRGFFLWWNQTYVTIATDYPRPRLTTVLSDLQKQNKYWGVAIYIALALTGILKLYYPGGKDLHKEICFKQGKQVAYTVYAAKNKYGQKAVIAQKTEKAAAND